jgi:hypothetical protein
MKSIANVCLPFIGIALFSSATGASSMGVACTMEAKLCPDGSAVGRTGPHCEFTPCPDANSGNKDTSETVHPPSNPAMGASGSPPTDNTIELHYIEPPTDKPPPNGLHLNPIFNAR